MPLWIVITVPLFAGSRSTPPESVSCNAVETCVGWSTITFSLQSLIELRLELVPVKNAFQKKLPGVLNCVGVDLATPLPLTVPPPAAVPAEAVESPLQAANVA